MFSTSNTKLSLSTPFKIRLRRNRRTPAIRSMVQETQLSAADLIAPIFLIEGSGLRQEIASMPGVYRFTIDEMLTYAQWLHSKGVQAIALFPVIESHLRNNEGDEAWNSEGIMPRAIRAVKEKIPSLCVIADVALDPYTSHGHDGVLNEKLEIANDATIDRLIQMALVQAEAGVDFVAPSDMMDGRVGAIRKALDDNGFENTAILAYSAKYASALYGPFRDAMHVNLQFGDKKTYQMDPANVKEALLEARLDEEEGADILMVKPALFYLDVIAKLRQETLRPIAAYHVSGEYAMVIAAAKAGYLNAQNVLYEALISIKRAGADLIFTYAIDAIIDRI